MRVDLEPHGRAHGAQALISYALEAVRQSPAPYTIVHARVTNTPVPDIDSEPGYIDITEHNCFVPLSPFEIEYWLSAAADDRRSVFRHLNPTPNGYVGCSGETPARVARRFLHHHFGAIQAIVCESSRSAVPRPDDPWTVTVASALAAWLMATFSMTLAVATGLAVVILLVLSEVAPDAPCRVTHDEVVQQISLLLEETSDAD